MSEYEKFIVCNSKNTILLLTIDSKLKFVGTRAQPVFNFMDVIEIFCLLQYSVGIGLSSVLSEQQAIPYFSLDL